MRYWYYFEIIYNMIWWYIFIIDDDTATCEFRIPLTIEMYFAMEMLNTCMSATRQNRTITLWKKLQKKLLAAAASLHNTLTEGKAENGLVSAMTIMLASGILTSEK